MPKPLKKNSGAILIICYFNARKHGNVYFEAKNPKVLSLGGTIPESFSRFSNSPILNFGWDVRYKVSVK